MFESLLIDTVFPESIREATKITKENVCVTKMVKWYHRFIHADSFVQIYKCVKIGSISSRKLLSWLIYNYQPRIAYIYNFQLHASLVLAQYACYFML